MVEGLVTLCINYVILQANTTSTCIYMFGMKQWVEKFKHYILVSGPGLAIMDLYCYNVNLAYWPFRIYIWTN